MIVSSTYKYNSMFGNVRTANHNFQKHNELGGDLQGQEYVVSNGWVEQNVLLWQLF